MDMNLLDGKGQEARHSKRFLARIALPGWKCGRVRQVVRHRAPKPGRANRFVARLAMSSWEWNPAILFSYPLFCRHSANTLDSPARHLLDSPFPA